MRALHNRIKRRAARISTRRIAPLFPIVRPAELNGVLMPPELVPPHRRWDWIIPFYHVENDSRKSMGEVLAHRSVTKPHDTVVIIGGGRGVSATHAARLCFPGQVTVYEPGLRAAELVQAVLKLNEIHNATVINASVGNTYVVWGRSSGQTCSIEDLPYCDVLEMDCEGAEFGIIQAMARTDRRPAHLIIEVHPHYADASGFMESMTRMGYRIHCVYTRRGDAIQDERMTENGQIYCFRHQRVGRSEDGRVRHMASDAPGRYKGQSDTSRTAGME